MKNNIRILAVNLCQNLKKKSLEEKKYFVGFYFFSLKNHPARISLHKLKACEPFHLKNKKERLALALSYNLKKKILIDNLQLFKKKRKENAKDCSSRKKKKTNKIKLKIVIPIVQI